MTEQDLIDIADQAYPDELVGECYRDRSAEVGDTLARFVANELSGFASEYSTDDASLAEAERRMRAAADELIDVAEAFAQERPTVTLGLPG